VLSKVFDRSSFQGLSVRNRKCDSAIWYRSQILHLYAYCLVSGSFQGLLRVTASQKEFQGNQILTASGLEQESSAYWWIFAITQTVCYSEVDLNDIL